MDKQINTEQQAVHCRTGSLENKVPTKHSRATVHCRTGSLEKSVVFPATASTVHCRTGSLEIYGKSDITAA